jgi:hypothetical protein
VSGDDKARWTDKAQELANGDVHAGVSHTRLLLALAVTVLAVACAPAFAQAPKAGIGGGKQSRARS